MGLLLWWAYYVNGLFCASRRRNGCGDYFLSRMLNLRLIYVPLSPSYHE